MSERLCALKHGRITGSLILQSQHSKRDKEVNQERLLLAVPLLSGEKWLDKNAANLNRRSSLSLPPKWDGPWERHAGSGRTWRPSYRALCSLFQEHYRQDAAVGIGRRWHQDFVALPTHRDLCPFPWSQEHPWRFFITLKAYYCKIKALTA